MSQPKLPPDIRVLTPEEYALRRKQREETGFVDDERERSKPALSQVRNRSKISITVPPEIVAIAKRCGYGNYSRGFEQACRFWLEYNPDERRKHAKKRVDVRRMQSGPRMRPLIALRKRQKKSRRP